ncbi:glycosyltransferase [Candidatus Peregrinibacteria bacterium]|nr:glycosyltransferase [Candidatus Peregrinibacteria bacterium]
MTDLLIKRTFLRHIFPGRMRRYLQWDLDPGMVRDVDWVVGACLLIRRTLLDQIGSFDPRFFLFFEDIDLCRRSWEVGKRVVYFPKVTAMDRKHRLSEGGLFSLLFHRTGRAHIRSALSYFWKWRGHPLPRR